jgi:Caspase domain
MSYTTKNIPSLLTKIAYLLMGRQFAYDLSCFYFIGVANTTDATIGKGCKQDLIASQQLFSQIALDMKFPYKEVLFDGETISKQGVWTVLENLKPKEKDVVIFYYSGHGFSYEKDVLQKFPRVDLRKKGDGDEIAVINAATKNITEIFKLIKSKGAGFNLVLGDCCNTLINFKRMFTSATEHISQKMEHVNAEMCQSFFLSPKASILIAAADKDQFAVTDESFGSIFTFSFTNKLKEILGSTPSKITDLSWHNLINTVRMDAAKLSVTYDCGNAVPCRQDAIFKIE